MRAGDPVIERLSVYLARLEVFCTRVGGQADEKHATPVVFQEWRHGVASHIRVHGQRVGLELGEKHSRIAFSRRVDVADFGVDEDGYSRWNVLYGGLQRGKAGLAEGTVKGEVGLVRTDEVSRRIDEFPVRNCIEFETTINKFKPGDRIMLTFKRKNEVIRL